MASIQVQQWLYLSCCGQTRAASNIVNYQRLTRRSCGVEQEPTSCLHFARHLSVVQDSDQGHMGRN